MRVGGVPRGATAGSSGSVPTGAKAGLLENATELGLWAESGAARKEVKRRGIQAGWCASPKKFLKALPVCSLSGRKPYLSASLTLYNA